MEMSDVRSLCRHFLFVLLILVIGLEDHRTSAQQAYGGTTYLCSDSGTNECGAFALYRAQTAYRDFISIGSLFNTDPQELATLNKLSANSSLTSGQPLIIPLICICFNQTSYANLTYIIGSGDTFYDLSVNTFEYLSTTQAMIDANPTVDNYNLVVGLPIIVPLRCACPSAAQLNANVQNLVTYPIATGDILYSIAQSFGVPVDSVINANTLGGSNPSINSSSTLLIPIDTSTPNYTPIASPHSPAPGPSS